MFKKWQNQILKNCVLPQNYLPVTLTPHTVLFGIKHPAETVCNYCFIVSQICPPCRSVIIKENTQLRIEHETLNMEDNFSTNLLQ